MASQFGRKFQINSKTPQISKQRGKKKGTPKFSLSGLKLENTKPSRNEALLQKYGLKANDSILAEEKHMGLYDELINNYDAKLIAGGAAQNTARGAQVYTTIPPFPAPFFAIQNPNSERSDPSRLPTCL